MSSLQIPDHSGAILLPDCTLFPHGALPLHIFEDRYRQMLDEALEGDCLFCVGRLLGKETDNLATCTAPVGTVALIRASRELPDGRSHLILHGVHRIRFHEWLTAKPYPYARISPLTSAHGPQFEWQDQIDRLRQTVEELVTGFPDSVVAQVESILKRSPTPSVMADAIAQQFIHDPDIRQHLLEETEVSKRVELVIANLKTLRKDRPQ